MKVGERLRQLRKARGMTQGQICDAVGLSRPTFSQMETGKSKIDADRLPAIAEVLRVDPCEFFREGELELVPARSTVYPFPTARGDVAAEVTRALARGWGELSSPDQEAAEAISAALAEILRHYRERIRAEFET